MQVIPTIDFGPSVNIPLLIAAVLIQTLLVIILGYNKQTRNLRYWVIAVIEVVVFVLAWVFLSAMASLVIITHSGYPLEITFMIINIVSFSLYLGLSIILVFIEKHRGVPKTDSEMTVVISE
jgi:hypothetical protein